MKHRSHSAKRGYSVFQHSKAFAKGTPADRTDLVQGYRYSLLELSPISTMNQLKNPAEKRLMKPHTFDKYSIVLNYVKFTWDL